MAAHARRRRYWWHNLPWWRGNRHPVAAFVAPPPAPALLPAQPVRMVGRHHRDPAPTAPMTLPDLLPGVHPYRHPYQSGENELVRAAYDAMQALEDQ